MLFDWPITTTTCASLPSFLFHINSISHFLFQSLKIVMGSANETSDFSGSNNPFVYDHILPQLLRLYGSCATCKDFEIYAPHASFEDPFMSAHGVKQIKSAFYSVSKVFSESKIVEYTIKENMVSPGHGEILIDSKQHYKLLGKDIDMVSLIKLYVEEGKIIRHEDWWDRKPISNRETVKMPLLGRVAEMTRRSSMLVTHVFMRFGKDPTM